MQKLPLLVVLSSLFVSLGALANASVNSHWVLPSRTNSRFEMKPIERTRPLIVGDILFFANLGGDLFAVHRTDGYILWQKHLPAGVEGALTYARSKIFVGDTQGDLFALNARDGSLVWHFKVPAEWLSPPMVMRDKVFLTSSADDLYALSESQGKEIWHYSHRGDEKMTIRGTSSPVQYGDAIFYGSSDGYLISLGAADGKVIWSKRLRGKERFYDVDMIPFADEHSVIAGTFDGKMYSLDRITGSTNWIFAAGNYGGVLVEENRVYFAGLDGNFYGLDKTTGQQLWKTPFQEGVGLAPTRSGDYIIFTTSNDPMYALDPKDGRVAWKGSLGSGTLAAATGNADGWFYCMSNYGNLYSFEITKSLIAMKGPETIPTPSAIYRSLATSDNNPSSP